MLGFHINRQLNILRISTLYQSFFINVVFVQLFMLVLCKADFQTLGSHGVQTNFGIAGPMLKTFFL